MLFAALAMMMISMPIADVGRLVGERATRLWRVLHHCVDQARSRADHSRVTLFVDLDSPRVLFVANGKNAATVEKFAAYFADHGGT